MSAQSDPTDPISAPPPGGREPIFFLPPATKWLALAMIAIFAVEQLLGDDAWLWFFSHFAFISIVFWPPGAALPSPAAVHSLFTYAFLHADFTHLAMNAGFLLAFGTFVERAFGTARCLLVFVVCAVVAALAELSLHDGDVLALVGASGAVYGMTGAAVYLMFLMRRGAQRHGLLAFVLVIMGLNLLLGLTGLGDFLAGAQIGWKAHLAGFVVGWILAALLRRRRGAPGAV